jgi:hypothetical protein
MLAIGLASLALAAPSQALDKQAPLVGVYSSNIGGGVLGITVLQPTSAHRARATVALSAGVAEKAKGAVGWSTKPCSRTFASPAAKGGGEVAIETLELAHEGLSFANRSVPLAGSVGKGKTVRVWNGPTQLACAAVVPRTAKVITAVFTGRIKGVFAAVQRRGSRTVRGYQALPDLDANASYRMVGSTRSCSRADTAGSRTFSLDLEHPGGFSAQLIEHLEDLITPPPKSVRLFSRLPGAAATQTACVKGSVVNVN